MDDYFDQPIPDFLESARLAITNAREMSEIRTVLVTFGYDSDELARGLRLLTEAEEAHALQQREYAEQYTATSRLQETRSEAQRTYAQHRALARLALRGDYDSQRGLQLDESQPRALDRFLHQAHLFYTNALEMPAVLTALARFRVTAEDLNAGKLLIERTSNKHARREREASEAQRATLVRDTALDALQQWISDLREVARIAFAADRQYLEALGIGPQAAFD